MCLFQKPASNLHIARCLRTWCLSLTRGLGRWVAGRPGPGARGQGLGPGSPMSLAIGRLSPVVRRQQTGQHQWPEWWGDPDCECPVVNMIQCSQMKKLLLLCFLSSAASGISEHIEASDKYPWCISNCALWMSLLWHDNCFNVLFRTWQEEDTVAFIRLHFARPEGWKAQGLRWVFLRLSRKKIEFRRFLMDSTSLVAITKLFSVVT